MRMRRTSTIVTTLPAATAALAAWLAAQFLPGGRPVRARWHRDVMAGYFPVDMPRYPGAKERPILGSAEQGQSRTFMSYFVTRDEPLAVVQFYERQWRAAGYHVTADVTLRGGHASALDVRTGYLRQIVCFRQGDHTIAFPSVTRGIPAGTGAPRAWQLPPVYPGAEGVTSFGARDPSATSAVLMFVDFASVEDNVAFYETQMAARGWKLEKKLDEIPKVDEKVASLVFRKEGLECTVNILPVAHSKQVRVHIVVVRAE